MKMAGGKAGGERELVAVTGLAIVCSILSVYAHLSQKIYGLFVSAYPPAVFESIVNFIFLYLVGLLYIVYRQWRRSHRMEEELERVISSISPDVLIVIDGDRNITLCNPSVERMFGYRADEVLNRKTDVLYSDRRSSPVKHHEIHDALEKEGFHVGFASGTRKDGSSIGLEIITAHLSEKQGAVLLLRDITQTVRAVNEQKESQRRFKSIFDNAVEGIFQSTPGGRYLSVNPSHARMHGYESPEELMERGLSIESIYVDPQDRRRLKESLERDGKVENFESQRYRKDGTTFWVSTNARVVRDPSGQTLYYEGTVEDISKRKEAEQALRQSEQKFRSIFENAVEGIYQTTPEGRFISVNPALARMIGFDNPEDAISSITDVGTQGYANPEDRERLRKILEDRGVIAGFEIEHYKKDGSKIWVSINARAVKDGKGKALFYEGTMENITSRKEAEEQLRISSEKLRRSLLGTIQAMSLTVETRDPYTAGHQRRVAALACAIAEQMGLPPDLIDAVRMAGTIHDIGKMSVPAEILSKPTRLVAAELNLIRAHSQAGYDILKDAGLPHPVADIVLQHHERLDGSGYPQGLHGTDILLGAAVLAVADVVEAISSHRPYRPALGIAAALAEIEQNCDILYHGDAARACLNLFREQGFAFR